MGKNHEIDIITYLLYEDFFLLDKADVDCLIENKIKNFDPIESICYSSFLNMVCQSTDSTDLIELQKNELRNLLKTHLDYPPSKIFFHRDTLLHYISRVISNRIVGKDNITGPANEKNSLKYYQSLLLINNKIDFLKYENFERELIKSFPYHVPNALYWVYKQRIIRYSYIYDEILPKIADGKKAILSAAINLMEERTCVNLMNYINTIKGLFIWFIGARYKGVKSPQFDRRNICTFYIDSRQFNSNFVATVEALSKDLNGFYREYQKERRDEIDNEVYLHFQRFFDFPVFKLNENQFCILDLKFLIEGICSGLIWKLDSIVRESNGQSYSIQAVREQYGYLLEEYFCFLMKRIFTDARITSDQIGEPDCILELSTQDDDYIIIIEFTTKYYRISSLYNESSDNFIRDLTRVLFNEEKSDRGKFINLDEYVSNYKNGNKKLIPILLTENWIGDYDLLNRMENMLDNKIQEHNLENVKTHRPVILSLDDMETFWAICTEGNEKKEFVSLIDKWEKEEKGKYVFNFANFISDGKKVSNEKYLEFFDSSNLAKY